MKDALNITKALADENRLRALAALRHGDLCVCQIVEVLDLAPSTVSKHMSILKQAELVESRKEGRWIHYRLPGRTANRRVRKAIDWLFDSLRDEPRLLEDEKRLRKILKIDPVELCRLQCGR